MTDQNVQPVLFDYGDMDIDTTTYLQQNAQETRTLLKRTTEDIIKIGENLMEAKARLPHGQFIPWVKTELGISQSTAWRFMQTAQGKEIKAKSFTVNDLMEQISAPEEKRDPFDAAFEFLNKSLDEATTIEELKAVHDRASEMQQIAAERTLRITRRMAYLLQNDEIKPSGYEDALMRATKKLEPLLKELEKTDYATFYKTGVVINREPTFEEWQATLVLLTKIAAITAPFNRE